MFAVRGWALLLFWIDVQLKGLKAGLEAVAVDCCSGFGRCRRDNMVVAATAAVAQM